MNAQEEATLSMAANAALSRRQGRSQRRQVINRHVKMDSDVTYERHWPSATSDKATQVDTCKQMVEADYIQKKTVLQGLAILAMFVLSTSDLHVLLSSVTPTRFYNLTLMFTAMAVVCQVLSGGFLAVIAIMERRGKYDLDVVRKMNDVTIFLAFVVVLISVFLSSLVDIPDSTRHSSSHKPHPDIVIE